MESESQNPHQNQGQDPQNQPQTPSREEILRATLSNIPNEHTPKSSPTQKDPSQTLELEPISVPEPQAPESVLTPKPTTEEPTDTHVEPSAPEPRPNLAQTPHKNTRTLGILITLLLIGLIAVIGVFAAKLTVKPVDVHAEVLKTTVTQFLNKDSFAYNFTFNYEFHSRADQADAVQGNVTVLTDIIAGRETLESKGTVLISLESGDFTINLSYLNKENDLYLKVDSFSSASIADTPVALALFPLDELTNKWIKIPYDDESLSLQLAGNEYNSQTEAANKLLDKMQGLAKTEGLVENLADLIVYVPELSNESQYVYSPNFTPENLMYYTKLLEIEFDPSKDIIEQTTSILNIINDSMITIDKNTNTISSVTVTNSEYNLEQSIGNMNFTITPISAIAFETPTESIDINELISQILGF